ncbi:MAG: metallophosphoesterase [Bacteroidota bacterium]|nr:metallophosphoesterase [Bacteroidota bacterium]
MRRSLKAVIISDVHLGTFGCHAEEMHTYLQSIMPEILIINGDFIDMWQFKKQYFPKDHIKVIQQILKLASKGTKVFYITGNHDDHMRKYSDFNTGNISLRD